MLSERQILDMLEDGDLKFPPLQIALLEKEVQGERRACDALLEVSWEDQSFRFAAEIKRYSSEKSVADALLQARCAADELSALPMVITPWLSEDQLERLQAEAISGIDLSGNGVLVVPGKLLIAKSGKPNAYPDTREVKNVYEGTSSLVGRVFLARPVFSSVNEIVEEIQDRSGSITQPTVSKALKQLEADLTIWRGKEGIKLLQGDKLLDRLTRDWKAPERLETITGKLNAPIEKLGQLISTAAKKAGAEIVMSGSSSVEAYGTMAREELFEIYCDVNPAKIVETLGKKADLSSRFPNFRIIRTDSPIVHFDKRLKSRVPIASPVQCYLELMQGDKREKETALQVKKVIFREIEAGGGNFQR